MFNEKPITEPEQAVEDIKQDEIVVSEPTAQEETMIKREGEPVVEERKIIPFNNGDWDEDDPFPQYMTKAETEEVLETWWARRNGATR
jgi:hypothetical protein